MNEFWKKMANFGMMLILIFIVFGILFSISQMVLRWMDMKEAVIEQHYVKCISGYKFVIHIKHQEHFEQLKDSYGYGVSCPERK